MKKSIIIVVFLLSIIQVTGIMNNPANIELITSMPKANNAANIEYESTNQCTCAGTSDCIIQCGCNITTNVNMQNHVMQFNGTGTSTITATISNAKIKLPIGTECKIRLYGGRIE